MSELQYSSTMATIQPHLESIRYSIAKIIETLEIWTTLPDVIDALGLQNQDTDGLGKYKYLLKVTTTAEEKVIINAAKQVINSYPGSRGKPSATDLQPLQDALWWIESNGLQQISNVTRFQIAESLEKVPFWGRLSIREFFYPILPAIINEFSLDSSLPEVGPDGLLYTGLSWIPFSNLFAGNPSKPMRPARVSVAEFLRSIGIADWPDKRLILFIERMVNPEVQSLDLQKKLVAQLNGFLLQDNFECRQEGVKSGAPIYKVRQKGEGEVRKSKRMS